MKAKELCSGKGGVANLSRWFMQMVDVPGIGQYRTVIANNIQHYERILAIINPKSIHGKTDQEIGLELFFVLGEKDYVGLIEKFAEMNRPFNMKVVAAYVAHDYVLKAFLYSYVAMSKVLGFIGSHFSDGKFVVSDISFTRYLALLRAEFIAGQHDTPPEEKNLLQLVWYGNLAGLDQKIAFVLIKKGVEVLRWGYITSLVSGAFMPEFMKAEEAFTPAFQEVMKQLTPKVEVSAPVSFKPVFTIDEKVKSKDDKLYRFPFFIIDPEAWYSGSIQGEVELQAFPEFPMFPTQEGGCLTTIFSPMGSGKTLVMNSMSSRAILEKGNMVFAPMGDDSNQLLYSFMPMFDYDRRTSYLCRFLRERMQTEPTGIPLTILNIIRPEEKVLLNSQTLTVFDRIIYVDDPKNFDVSFDKIFREHKSICKEHFGLKDRRGYISVRNLMRYNSRDKTYTDIQIAANLLFRLDVWKTSHEETLHLFLDEVHQMAPASLKLAGSDTSSLSGTIGTSIRSHRRKNTSIMCNTQQPLELIPELRNMSTNIIFRDLPVSSKKDLSQMESLLDSLSLIDQSQANAVKEINRKGLFSGKSRFWFWFYRPKRMINVLWSCPPPHMLQDTTTTYEKIVKMYEERFNKKVIVTDVEQVPVIQDLRETSTVSGAKRKEKERAIIFGTPERVFQKDDAQTAREQNV